MKKRIVLLAILSIALIAGFVNYRQVKAKESKIEEEYELDYESLQLDAAGSETKYVGADAVDEAKLKEMLAKYYADCAEEGIDEVNLVTFDEIIDYLSSEYDEDGDLYVLDRPAEIEDYEQWYADFDETVDENLFQYFRRKIVDKLESYNLEQNVDEVSDGESIAFKQMNKLIEMLKNGDQVENP